MAAIKSTPKPQSTTEQEVLLLIRSKKNSKMMIRSRLRRGGKNDKNNSGAFPSLKRNGGGHAAVVGATHSDLTEKSFNPEHCIINTAAENVTVSTITNDISFHSMKRLDCGIDYDDKKNRGNNIDDLIQERKNWYKKYKNDQTYAPLRDIGSAFTAPESFMSEGGHDSCHYRKSSPKLMVTSLQVGRRCRSTKRWLGKHMPEKLSSWRWSSKVVWWGKRNYSDVGSRESGSLGGDSVHKDDRGGYAYEPFSSVCLTYCDDSGVREEQLVWNK